PERTSLRCRRSSSSRCAPIRKRRRRSLNFYATSGSGMTESIKWPTFCSRRSHNPDSERLIYEWLRRQCHPIQHVVQHERDEKPDGATDPQAYTRCHLAAPSQHIAELTRHLLTLLCHLLRHEHAAICRRMRDIGVVVNTPVLADFRRGIA